MNQRRFALSLSMLVLFFAVSACLLSIVANGIDALPLISAPAYQEGDAERALAYASAKRSEAQQEIAKTLERMNVLSQTVASYEAVLNNSGNTGTTMKILEEMRNNENKQRFWLFVIFAFVLILLSSAFAIYLERSAGLSQWLATWLHRQAAGQRETLWHNPAYRRQSREAARDTERTERQRNSHSASDGTDAQPMSPERPAS